MELLGKVSHTWKESGSRFGSLSLLAYGRREQFSSALERNRQLLCWASFQLQSHRVVALSIKSDTSSSTLEKEDQVVQPCMEVVQMPLFISSIERQQEVVEWLMSEWELYLYPETCLPLQRELLSFLPAKATEAYERGYNWLQIVATVEEFTSIVKNDDGHFAVSALNV